MTSCITQKNKGFTLVEFLLYIALAVIMMAILSTVGAQVLESRTKAHSLEEIHYNAQFISTRLKQSILEATAINVPESLESTDMLSLVMQEESKNPTVFSLVEGDVWMTEGSNFGVQLSSGDVFISELTFLNTAFGDMLGIIRVEMEIGAYGVENQRFYMTNRIKK